MGASDQRNLRYLGCLQPGDVLFLHWVFFGPLMTLGLMIPATCARMAHFSFDGSWR